MPVLGSYPTVKRASQYCHSLDGFDDLLTAIQEDPQAKSRFSDNDSDLQNVLISFIGNIVNRYIYITDASAELEIDESIVKKLQRLGKDTSLQNMVEHVNDIAGVRIVCSFTTDIYLIAEMIRRLKRFEVLKIKDYIENPKQSGYRSYHLIINVPVYTSMDIIYTKVEIQIRTIAMDFWASLEHKIQYKFEGDAPENISRDLRSCAKIVAMLDEKMLSLNEEIRQANPD